MLWDIVSVKNRERYKKELPLIKEKIFEYIDTNSYRPSWGGVTRLKDLTIPGQVYYGVSLRYFYESVLEAEYPLEAVWQALKDLHNDDKIVIWFCSDVMFHVINHHTCGMMNIPFKISLWRKVLKEAKKMIKN